MRYIFAVILCLHLAAPLAAQVQTVIKTPLSYSLLEYGSVLAVALLGGLVSWYSKVKKGELVAWNISALIGELCVSAFAGLMAFWLCEYFNLNQLLTACVVGMSGHAGAKGLAALESLGQKVIEKKLGIEPQKDAP